MATTPTQRAEYYFSRAKNNFLSTLAGDDASIPEEMRSGLQDMVDGMASLSAGVRATYTLLSEVQKTLQQIQQTLQQNRVARL
jgi:hypothetical protein